MWRQALIIFILQLRPACWNWHLTARGSLVVVLPVFSRSPKSCMLVSRRGVNAVVGLCMLTQWWTGAPGCFSSLTCRQQTDAGLPAVSLWDYVVWNGWIYLLNVNAKAYYFIIIHVFYATCSSLGFCQAKNTHVWWDGVQKFSSKRCGIKSLKTRSSKSVSSVLMWESGSSSQSKCSVSFKN